MTLPTLSAGDFLPLIPALILSVAAVILLLSEVFLSPNASRGYQSMLTGVAALGAGGVALLSMSESPHSVFLGFGVLDPFSSFITLVVCVTLALAALLSSGFLRQRQAERGEFYALMCFASAGMSLLALSAELITLFINLEVMSIATYALTAYLRRGTRPSEAGFKYFILGAFSTALLLYGTSLLYGVTGTTMLSKMAGPLGAALQDHGRSAALAYCGITLIGAGFAFKVAAIPFHMWTPDVYEGAPTPVTALMSAGVKAAAFAALVRVFLTLSAHGDNRMALGAFSALAFVTMLGGNLMALPQRNVKRMLAYSSIAHAGYLLVGVAALFANPQQATPGLHLFTGTAPGLPGLAMEAVRSEALRGILFYLLAYAVTVVGAFGTLGALERREDEERGKGWDLERFSGLVHRRPGWAVAMAVFMLSLGGIPPTVGFMGKLFIFRAGVDAGLVGLVVMGVLSSAVGVYYYLRVVVHMFMRPAAEGQLAPERHASTDFALCVSTVAVMLFGIAPHWVSGWITQASSLLLSP